jgi:hypothetical protein
MFIVKHNYRHGRAASFELKPSVLSSFNEGVETGGRESDF